MSARVLWAEFHTGVWHAYPSSNASGRWARSACRVATSRIDDLEANPEAGERHQCRQCRIALEGEYGLELERSVNSNRERVVAKADRAAQPSHSVVGSSAFTEWLDQEDGTAPW